jgi:SNF2 family DNA or RNA helicase
LTGKTVTTIATILRLLEANKTDKNLICATKGSLPEIMNDFKKFYGFEPYHIYDNEQMNNFFDGDKNVGILRYEYFRRIDPNQFKGRLHNSHSSMFIDEAQKLKNQGTQAHKYVKHLRTSLDYFNLMTATPLMTSLDDMYNLMYLVDPRALGDYDTFVNKYYERELVPKFPNLLKGKCPNCGRYSAYCRFVWSTNYIGY